jgi:hypothetical protein
MSNYKCSCCEYTSKTKWNVQSHISKVCKEAELIEEIIKVPCSICSKQFNTERLLAQHMEKCVEKKAFVKIEYANPEAVNLKMDSMNAIIRTLIDQNEQLKRSNEEILKRLEKLENKNKDPYDELDHESSTCEYFVNEGPAILSYEQVCDFLQISKEDRRASMKISVLENGDVQNATMSVASIKADGKIFHFDPKNRKKGDHLASELRISKEETCEEVAKFFHRTKEILCCEQHKTYFS